MIPKFIMNLVSLLLDIDQSPNDRIVKNICCRIRKYTRQKDTDHLI